MKFRKLGEEYIATSIFNDYTAKAIRNVVKTFMQRAEIADTEDIDMESLARFKVNTLKIVKPVTYNGYLRYLRLIGRYAVEQGILPDNPFKRIPLAPIGELPKKTYKKNLFNQMVVWIQEHPAIVQPWWFWVAVVQTLFYTGMRRRQLVGLKLSDLNFVDRTVRLGYEGSKTKREWYVPMHPELAEGLEEYLIHYQMNAGVTLHPNSPLFSVYRFHPAYKHENPFDHMKPEQITGFFKRLSRKMGVSVGAQRFRHTLATLLCNPEDGGAPDIFAAQDILGHAKLETTRGYVEKDITRMCSAINRLSHRKSKKKYKKCTTSVETEV